MTCPHRLAQGFIRINAVRLRAYNALQRKFHCETKTETKTGGKADGKKKK